MIESGGYESFFFIISLEVEPSCAGSHEFGVRISRNAGTLNGRTARSQTILLAKALEMVERIRSARLRCA